MTDYPYRIRLKGGRHVHSARHAAGFVVLVTLCGRVTTPADERLDDDAPVTCRTCQQASR